MLLRMIQRLRGANYSPRPPASTIAGAQFQLVAILPVRYRCPNLLHIDLPILLLLNKTNCFCYRATLTVVFVTAATMSKCKLVLGKKGLTSTTARCRLCRSPSGAYLILHVYSADLDPFYLQRLRRNVNYTL
jgi:hypothetical protein